MDFRKVVVLLSLLSVLSCGIVCADVLDPVFKVVSVGAAGTGVVFEAEADSDLVYGMTNSHVVGQSTTVQCVFWKYGHQSSPIAGNVILNTSEADTAVIAIQKASFGDDSPHVIPLAPRNYVLTAGQTIASAGCAKASWSTAFRGHVKGYTEDQVAFVPPPLEGRSGSPLTDANGTMIVGLVRARADIDPVGTVGLAVPVQTIYRALDKQVSEKIAVQQLQCPAGGNCGPIRGRRQQDIQPSPSPSTGGGLWPTLPQAGASSGKIEEKLDRIAGLLEAQSVPSAITSPLPIMPDVTSERMNALEAAVPQKIAEAVKPLADGIDQVKKDVQPLVQIRDHLLQTAEAGGLKGKVAQKVLDKFSEDPLDDDPIYKSPTLKILFYVLCGLAVFFVLYRIQTGNSLLGKFVDKAQTVATVAAGTNPVLAAGVNLANPVIDTIQARVANLEARVLDRVKPTTPTQG